MSFIFCLSAGRVRRRIGPSTSNNQAPQYGTFSNRLARASDANSRRRGARIMWSSSILRPLATRIATKRLALPFHKMTERHQWADAVTDDLGYREHRG